MIWIFIISIIAIVLVIVWSGMSLSDRTERQNEKMVIAYNSASILTPPPLPPLPTPTSASRTWISAVTSELEQMNAIWFESPETVTDWLYEFGFKCGPGAYSGSWLAANEYFQMGQKDRGGNAE